MINFENIEKKTDATQLEECNNPVLFDFRKLINTNKKKKYMPYSRLCQKRLISIENEFKKYKKTDPDIEFVYVHPNKKYPYPKWTAPSKIPHEMKIRSSNSRK